MKITLEVKEVTVLHQSNGPDIIFIKFFGHSPFPEMQALNPDSDYGPCLRIETRAGFAEEWLKMMKYDQMPAKVINS